MLSSTQMGNPRIIEKWKEAARKIQEDLHVCYLACRHPGTPWYAKALGVCVVGYALSPIDLIPDPIPILGYLDDLILLPLGITAVRKMIPPAVLAECRAKAREGAGHRRSNWIAGGVIIAVWVLLLAAASIWLGKYFL